MEIKPQTRLVEEEVRIVKMEIHVKTIEPQVGTEPLLVQVKITKIIVEERNV